MKKLNILLASEDEDTLRKLNRKWNEPQRQKINGGVFNSKGNYSLNWDIGEDKGRTRFKERHNKMYGLLEKGIGKKFDDIYSKLCRSGLADKRVWWRSVREDFLSQFKRVYGDYYIDNNGLIQHRDKGIRKVHRDIKIPYEKPIITYKVNHNNLKSVSDLFIEEFGTDTYNYLFNADEIKELEYIEYMNKWEASSCRKVMEASRRSRTWKPRYYTLDRIENLFRFIFDKKCEYYKKIIKYGTKEYIEYKKHKKRSINYLTDNQRLHYDKVMRDRKKSDKLWK